MKNYIVGCLSIFLFQPNAFGQINLNRSVQGIKSKVENRINNKIERGVDKALDNAESILSKPSGNTGKQEDVKLEGIPNKSQELPSALSSSQNIAKQKDKNQQDSLKNTFITRFDFVTGDQLLNYESFESDAVGDFPANWDTDAGGEVVTTTKFPGKWFKLGREGFYLPESFGPLPENFTLEFDILVNDEFSWFSGKFKTAMVNTTTKIPDKRLRNASGVVVMLHPINAASNAGTTTIVALNEGKELMENSQDQKGFTVARKAENQKQTAHVSIWKQGTRIRVYLNENKVWDLPRAFSKDIRHDRLFFLSDNVRENENYFITNLKLTESSPNQRSKLITEGTLTTYGILFDSNSDNLKNESYGTIKEIAMTLKENPQVRIKIIGHTDADGTRQNNNDLSSRRANSVKKALIQDFDISEIRIETEGRGSSEPVAPNDSPLNKAKNRRVQFIKI
jgi:OmpA-OmpF porin, OOP family